MAIPAAFLYAILLRRLAIVKAKTEGEMYKEIRACDLGRGGA